MKSFAELLEEFRNLRGMSKKDLALKADLAPSYISLLISGGRTAPSEETIQALADALGLNTESHSLLRKAAGYTSNPTSHTLGSEVYFSDTEVNKDEGISNRENWGEAPNVQVFYGRLEELAKLEQWVDADQCRVVLVWGMGGVGKTMLVTKLAKQIQHNFEYIFWRSLQNTPAPGSILKEAIQFFSDQGYGNIPELIDEQIALLITYLRKRRCLMVLDNVESVLQERQQFGQYREGYEGYVRLFKALGEIQHQSSLLLTSREKLKDLARLEGNVSPVRVLQIEGVGLSEVQKMFADEGLIGSEENWAELVHLYSGNPLALKLIVAPIRDLFGGSISTFLKEGETVIGDIHDLLEQQFYRLSTQERDIMYWLAIEREAISLDELSDDIVQMYQRGTLLEILYSLQRRSLIERRDYARFALLPVIMEYVTLDFVEQVYKEIFEEKLRLFDSHALIKAQAKEYVRNSQIRHILRPLAERLLAALGKEGIESKLKAILSTRRAKYPQKPGYAVGNILNLLIQQKDDLNGYDFSNLVIWQAYLQGVSATGINFTDATITRSVFTDTFGSILSVTIDPEGEILAAGTANGEVRLWRATMGTPLYNCYGHTDWVRSVTFSPDGQMVASGSDDQTIRFWSVSTGQSLTILHGHQGRIRSVTFSPDGNLLASGGEDQTIRLWSVHTGQVFKTLQGHHGRIRSVAFSPDGKLLVSGSDDGTIRLWQVETGRAVKNLRGHLDRVYTVAFSPDGQTIASGSEDRTIRLWEVSNGQSLAVLRGHRSRVRAVAFSPDRQLLISGSDDQTIICWRVSTGEPVRTLSGHSDGIWAVVFSRSGRTIISGSDDQTIRLWEVSSGQCIRTLQGHTDLVWSVAFSPDGQMVASGSEDNIVRLWEVSSGQCIRTLQGHAGRIWGALARWTDGCQRE